MEHELVSLYVVVPVASIGKLVSVCVWLCHKLMACTTSATEEVGVDKSWWYHHHSFQQPK